MNVIVIFGGLLLALWIRNDPEARVIGYLHVRWKSEDKVETERQSQVVAKSWMRRGYYEESARQEILLIGNLLKITARWIRVQEAAQIEQRLGPLII